jgi:hypothetical protein
MLKRLLLTLIVATALAGFLTVTNLAAQSPVPTAALSFDVGEERMYRIGPAESLGLGESAEWTIALRSIVEEEDGYVANFDFTHERFEHVPGSFSGNGDFMIVSVEGRLRTNLAGFPLWLEYEQDFSVDRSEMFESGRRTIRYTYEGGRAYRKVVKAGRRDWDFRVAVPNYDHLREDLPSGLYVYMPTAVECLGTARRTCMEMEPAFANPGFLSMLSAELEELDAESKRDFMFFMPGAVAETPFRPLQTGDWLSRERDNLGNMQRYFEIAKVELGTSWDVEVGPKTVHAWELDMCCGIEQAYIEPDGRVVRVNLERTMTNGDRRYIRLVFPFEDFLLNEDPVLR